MLPKVNICIFVGTVDPWNTQWLAAKDYQWLHCILFLLLITEQRFTQNFLATLIEFKVDVAPLEYVYLKLN